MSLTVDELRGIIETVEMTASGGIDPFRIDTDFREVFHLDNIKNFDIKTSWGWDFVLPKHLGDLEDMVFEAKASLVALEFAKIVLANWKEVSNDHHDANVRTYQAEIGDETYEVSFVVDKHGCYEQPLWVSRHHR